MNIKILGSCCGNCKKLQQLATEVVKEIGIEADIEKIGDMQKIMGYGVMSLPALVVNEKVKVFGKVPSKDEIKKYIEEEK